MNDLSLIETMRWEPETGIVRLRLHMARLARSAGRLGFAGADKAQAALASELPGSSEKPLRVRLTLDEKGRIDITTAPFQPLPSETVWRVRVAAIRLSSQNKLLRHKTSRRGIYETARAEHPATAADEVLLLNEYGAPCEGTITSLFLDDGSGQLKTPPIANGLLAGVLRTELICVRKARVERFGLEDIRKGRLFMGNSLRGLIRAKLLD